MKQLVPVLSVSTYKNSSETYVLKTNHVEKMHFRVSEEFHKKPACAESKNF
jgi:hypothetical protein